MSSNKKGSTIKKIATSVLVSATLIGTMSFGESNTAFAKQYPDVKQSDYFYNSVDFFTTSGYIIGYDDGLFHPYATLTHEHAALIMTRIVKPDMSNIQDPHFSDVPRTHPYYKEIAALANRGIIKGKGDGTFGLYEPVTRGQMASMIARAFDFGDIKPNRNTPFTDVKGTPFEEDVSMLFQVGGTIGVTPTTFEPYTPVNRASFVTFLNRTMDNLSDRDIKGASVKVNEDQTLSISGQVGVASNVLVKVYPFGESNAKAIVDQAVKVDENRQFYLKTPALEDGKSYTVEIQRVDGGSKVVRQVSIPAQPKPDIPDVEDGKYYNHPITINFKTGNVKVKLDNGEFQEIQSGTVLDKDGSYTLIYQGPDNKTVTIKFVIDQVPPIVHGVDNGRVYGDDVTISYNEGEATLQKDNGQAITITDNYTVTEDGVYHLVVTDKAGNKTQIEFTIDKSMPVIEGVGDGKIYSNPVTVSYKNGKGMIAYNDGQTESFASGTTFIKDGTYRVVVANRNGKKATCTFTIDASAPAAPTLTQMYNNPSLPTFVTKWHGPTVRYSLVTEGPKAAKVGDTLNIRVYGKYEYEKKAHILTQEDINLGYVEHIFTMPNMTGISGITWEYRAIFEGSITNQAGRTSPTKAVATDIVMGF